MAKVNQQIVGLGGHGDSREQTRALMRHVIGLTGKERPRVMHVPTATGDGADGIVAFYERCFGLGDLSHLTFHPWPPSGLRELGLHQVVTCRPDAAAYRVTRAGEERLQAALIR